MAAPRMEMPLPQKPFGSQAARVKVATGFGVAVSTIGIVSRLMCGRLDRKPLRLSGWLAVASYIFKLALDICSLLLVQYGLGSHLHVIAPKTLTAYLKTIYVWSLVYIPCISLIKFSVMALYWQSLDFKHIKKLVVFVSSIVVAWAAACCGVRVVVCWPIHKSWHPGAAGSCINIRAYYYGMQIPNIVTDFVILFMPFKALWQLRERSTRALPLAAVFTTGLLTCVFAIIRIVVLLQLSSGSDITWNQVDTVIWTSLEPSMAILCACLPRMLPLYTRIKPSVTRARCWLARDARLSRKTWNPTRSRQQIELDEQTTKDGENEPNAQGAD